MALAPPHIKEVPCRGSRRQVGVGKLGPLSLDSSFSPALSVPNPTQGSARAGATTGRNDLWGFPES